jgi:hypothetical protein
MWLTGANWPHAAAGFLLLTERRDYPGAPSTMIIAIYGPAPSGKGILTKLGANFG